MQPMDLLLVLRRTLRRGMAGRTAVTGIEDRAGAATRACIVKLPMERAIVFKSDR